MTQLVQVDDADFDWLIANDGSSRSGRTITDGGVESPSLLALIRGMTARLHAAHCRGAWMIVSDDVVVGLCSYRRPPVDGEVEIGYGVAAAARGRGHATRAVALIVDYAGSEGLSTLVAEASLENPASSRVLERNGFTQTRRRIDAEDGEVQGWLRQLR